MFFRIDCDFIGIRIRPNAHHPTRSTFYVRLFKVKNDDDFFVAVIKTKSCWYFWMELVVVVETDLNFGICFVLSWDGGGDSGGEGGDGGKKLDWY